MHSAESRAEYEQRLHRVLAHIDAHLDESLDLVTLAGVANFSPFHFHRLFTALMDETLGNYLRRRRVEIAALRLIAQPRVSVLRVALGVGFGSPEALTRAFKARFGSAPSVWRVLHRQQSGGGDKERNPGQVLRNVDQDQRAASRKIATSRSHSPEVVMQVKLLDRAPVTVAYVRHVGPYGDPILEFWQHIYYPWAVSNDLLSAPRYGISHDDPNITSALQCRYDACAEVTADRVVSGPALKTVIPGGRYASARFEGTSETIGAAWRSLLRDWLPSSGLQLDARLNFEYYPAGSRFDPATGVFDCDICIPVAPL
ncbi:MAG: AraC family transcriptional regulator [Gemmatimonadota bacterium]